ncbi:MAG: hypothetical protein ACO1SV_12340 [Fimbriimonas sp.]
MLILFGLIAILAALLATGALKPYRLPNSYFAQVEGSALANLRIGYTAIGLYWPHLLRNGRSKAWRFLPRFSLTLWSHTGSCDQRWVFKIRVGSNYIGYRTRGDATPAMSAYKDAGLRTRLRFN